VDENDRRELLSTAFEPCDGGYLYYRNRWAGGVKVSADERERFISSGAAGAMQLGREFARRTPVTPPRHASPWLIVDAMPMSLAAGLIAVALAAAAEANRPNPLLPPSVFWCVAIFMAAAALTLAARRFFRGGRA
jgi:hypothetical protein